MLPQEIARVKATHLDSQVEMIGLVRVDDAAAVLKKLHDVSLARRYRPGMSCGSPPVHFLNGAVL